MAAYLYPGIKSLQLVLDKPYDAIRTTDVRDDLASVKVWYSITSGFNPNNGEGTLVPSGNSLNVTITGLTPNTRYYVKYAFVSAIDEDEVDPAGPTGPGSYTVSAQLTAVVYDENVSVYGYLSNDPTPIVTKADGTGGDFTNATGVFKLFYLSQDVTGAGPVYGIKANSNDSLTTPVINATTGVYSCAGLTDDGGNVTFTATYNNVVVEQVWNVYRAKAGETAPLLQLSTPNKEFLYKDQFATSSLTPSTTVTARLVNLTGTPTFTVQAFTRDNTTTPLGNIEFTQATNTITITSAQFNPVTYNNTVGTVKVTATLGTASDVLTLYRINDGSEQINVELTNEAHQIPSYQDGTTTASSYVGSGTVIQVKEGNTYLNVDNTAPFANGTWRITTIDDVNITCDTTPGVGVNFIDFNEHSAMDAATDAAYIDYTITGTTTTGKAFTIVKRQSFAKSKEGLKGATARAVTITAPSQIFVTAKNTTTASPTSIVLTAVQSNFVNPTYTWLVDGVAPASTVGTASTNTFTLNSFAAVGSKTVKVTATETIDSVAYSQFDIFTVYSLREGDDAFVGGLSNENQTISYDSAGDAITGQFPVTSTFYAALGTTFLSGLTTPAVTFAKVSYDGSTTATDCAINNVGVITISALNVNSATAVFTATLNSGTANAKTITKSLTLNKSKDGAVGKSAISAIVSNETHVFPADKDGNVSTYSNSGTQIRVYEGATELAYGNGITGNSTWTVTTSATNITVGTITDSGTYATVAAHSGVAVGTDTSSITYTITGKSSAGVDFTITKTQTFSKSKIGATGGPGAASLVYDIVTSTPVIVKDAPDAATTGAYTSITFQGKKYDGATTTNYGWITVTANGDAEASTATDTASTVFTLSPASNSGKSSYTAKLYNQAAVSGATLLDTQFIAVVFKGAKGDPGAAGNSAINAIVSNGTHVFPANKDGGVTSYANSGTQLRVYEGATELSYDGAGTSNSTWTFTTTPSNITVGAVTDSGTYATIAAHSAVLDGNDSSAITYNITGKSSAGVAFSTTQTQTFSKSRQGATGLGNTGASNHRAYRAYATASPPTTAPDATTNGAAPITRAGGTISEIWSLSPVTITEGNAQYQTDGITAAGATGTGNTTWGVPYLSYFKVGNLQAISANTGALTVTGTITVADDTSGAVLITTSGMAIYSGPSSSRVLRVKLGSI